MKKIIFILLLLIIFLSGAVGYLLFSKSTNLSSPVSKLINNVSSQFQEVKPSKTIGNWSLSGAKIILINQKNTLPSNLNKDIKAELKICNLGPSCSGDNGNTHWMKTATINNQDLKRGMSWTTESKEVDSGLLQISAFPFVNTWPVTTLYAQNVSNGIFVFDFNSIVFSQPSAKSNSNFLGNIFRLSNTVDKLKLDYYIRIIPMKNGQIVGAPTNEVSVKLVPPPDDSQSKLYAPPKIYTVKIKEFTPLLAPDKGICTQAMILDTPALIGTELKNVGDRICPSPYKGIGEKAWYEQFWDALTSGASWISEAYNSLKSSVVDAVGSVACAGDSDCKKLLSAGLDIGLAAMGVPPTIPNFDKLVDGGFDYLASELSSAAGCPDIACKNLVKKGLKETLDKKKNSNPGCMDATVAHNMGIEPICLPNGAKAHWDPKATYRDANAVLEVTRNFINAPDQKNSSYKILLSSWSVNNQAVGQKIINIEPYNKTLDITQPLTEELFQYKIIPIPNLEKGQTILIPVNFIAKEYWVPGHKELMKGWTTVTYKDGWPQYQYDDWWLLYYGAKMTMSAKIDGCQYYGGVGCIVSEDIKNYDIPSTLNP